MESTFRNRPKATSLTIPVAIVLLLIVGGIALWALRADPPVAATPSAPTKPTATAAAPPTTPPTAWTSAPAPATASAAPAAVPATQPSTQRPIPSAVPGKRSDIDPGSTPF